MKYSTQDIVEAFEKTELAPVFAQWGDCETTGCALDALIVQKYPDRNDRLYVYLEGKVQRYARLLEISYAEALSYIRGWDNVGLGPYSFEYNLWSSEFVAARQAGLEVLRKRHE